MPKKWSKVVILADFRPFGKNEFFARHENFQNSLSRGLIVVLKVTVYRPTRVKIIAKINFRRSLAKKSIKQVPPFWGGVGLRWGWAQRVKCFSKFLGRRDVCL